MSRRKERRKKLIADLNITNLVDVIFTLLIIFMITAPMMTQGVQVDLPKTHSENVEVNEYVQVSINKQNEIFINQERVSLLDFSKRFRQVFAGRTRIPVFVNGDKQVPYGLIVRVLAEIQNAGAVKLGFLSQPLDKSGGI
jgi:biopolymer transport protein TolR